MRLTTICSAGRGSCLFVFRCTIVLILLSSPGLIGLYSYFNCICEQAADDKVVVGKEAVAAVVIADRISRSELTLDTVGHET